MTDIQKYTFQQITDISFSGFIYTIPEDTITMINHLCSNVGSECLNANVFQKKEASRVPDAASSLFKQNNKKAANTAAFLIRDISLIALR